MRYLQDAVALTLTILKRKKRELPLLISQKHYGNFPSVRHQAIIHFGFYFTIRKVLVPGMKGN